MEHHLVLRIVAKCLIPLIMLFALYVQFHGEYGPGGGFQAGVIFAVAFILYALIHGVEHLMRVLPSRFMSCLAATGVLLYILVGLVGIFKGGEFLNYSVLAGNPVTGQHIGIILIELGVGITVASSIILIFYAFTRG